MQSIDETEFLSEVSLERSEADPSHSHRFYLEDGNLELELDDGKTYKVHRYFFQTHSPAFTARYLSEEPKDIVHLPNVSSVDFEQFLSLIYPSEIGECDIQAVDQWTSVLRLATKWTFPRLRALAIREIEPQATAIDKVAIAREFGFGNAWLLPAFTAICQSSSWLTYDEAARLGLRTAVEIGRIREERLLGKMEQRDYDVTAAVCSNNILIPSIVGGGDNDDGLSDAVLAPSFPFATADATDEVTATDTEPILRAIPVDTERLGSAGVEAKVPGGLERDLPANPSQLTEIGEQLAQFTLQTAELAEAKRFCGTDLDRALFALRMANRIAEEHSPAAQRHRQWRQMRIDQIVRGLMYDLPQDAHQLDIESRNPWSCFENASHRIAQLIAKQVSLTSPDVADGSTPRTGGVLTLTVNGRDCAKRVKIYFLQKGLEVVDKENNENAIEIIVPYAKGANYP